MGTVISLNGAKEAPKSLQSKMETLIVNQTMVSNFKIPPFQRPLRLNEKVRMVAEQIRRTESIEGVLTLGRVKNDPAIYVVDGQHRIEAFKISEISEALADVRVIIFDNMSEMAREFVQLNSALAKMGPDDILRGLESSTSSLKAIRRSCEFVGYDQVRRGKASPVLSMSALLRCWSASTYETPSPSNGVTAAVIAETIDGPSLSNLIAFLNTAHAAWGRDPEYYRLWGNLNLAVCMWLWNRMVIDQDRSGNKRYVVLSVAQFKKCLMSLSAEGDYLAWLPGRNLGDRDRSPCYGRIKSIFISRLASENGGKRPVFPAPAWASK